MLFNTIEVSSPVKSTGLLGLVGLLGDTSEGARVLSIRTSSRILVVMLFWGGFRVMYVDVVLPFKLTKAETPLLVPLLVLLLQQTIVGGGDRVS